MAAERRVYRGSSRLLVGVTGTAGLGGVGLLAAVLTVSWLAPAARAGLALAVATPIVALLVRAWRSVTIVTRDGFVARGLLSTTAVAWPDVQEIRVELNPGIFASTSAPGEIVVAYLGSARTVILPHLNRGNLRDFGLDLNREADAIRRTWLAARGPEWTPDPRVARKVADQVRYGVSSWFIGFIPAAFSIPVYIVIFLVGLWAGVTDRAPAPLSWLFNPVAALVVPVLAYLVGSLFSVAHRRRAALRRDRR